MGRGHMMNVLWPWNLWHDECALAMESLADTCPGTEALGLRLSLLLTHGLPGGHRLPPSLSKLSPGQHSPRALTASRLCVGQCSQSRSSFLP